MIGLFGGSFDPIHHGHLITAQTLVHSLGLAELRFIPAREQPFKHGRHQAPAEVRAKMVELAIAGEPRLRLDRLELERPGPSYTVDTLRALRVREPASEFVLLVGSDAAAELAAWREAAELPRLASIVVFARPGSKGLSSPLISRVIPVPGIEISATAIRRRVRQGLSIRYWVPDAVAGVIAAERLYLTDDDQ